MMPQNIELLLYFLEVILLETVSKHSQICFRQDIQLLSLPYIWLILHDSIKVKIVNHSDKLLYDNNTIIFIIWFFINCLNLFKEALIHQPENSLIPVIHKLSKIIEDYF